MDVGRAMSQDMFEKDLPNLATPISSSQGTKTYQTTSVEEKTLVSTLNNILSGANSETAPSDGRARTDVDDAETLKIGRLPAEVTDNEGVMEPFQPDMVIPREANDNQGSGSDDTNSGAEIRDGDVAAVDERDTEVNDGLAEIGDSDAAAVDERDTEVNDGSAEGNEEADTLELANENEGDNEITVDIAENENEKQKAHLVEVVTTNNNGKKSEA